MPSKPQTVLITGATGKLGGIFAAGFSAMRWNIVFTARDSDKAASLQSQCIERGATSVKCVRVDLTAPDATAVVAGELARMQMLPDVLVNNARDLHYLRPTSAGRMSRANWQGEMVLGVVVPYELTMALAEMPKSPLRTVINVASIYGISAANRALYLQPDVESPINYGVTKAALIHLTKELAVRLAGRSIAVNTVSYGGVKGRADDAFEQRYGRLCPSGRMLDESEVFGAVKFLASSDSSGMTGHNLVVDGGWSIW